MKRLTLSLAVVGFSFLVGLSAPTQAQQEICRDVGEVHASSETKVVELPTFGISVTIPENYEIFEQSSTIVEILDPGTYALKTCAARGGHSPFGRGLSGTRIEIVDNPNQLSPLELALQDSRYVRAERYVYDLDGIATEIFVNSEYVMSDWFNPSSVDGVVAVTPYCDCPMGLDDIVMDLNRIHLLSDD